MKKKKRRQIFILLLVVLCWGSFPAAYYAANLARGGFAVGGEYALFIFPFVISEIVFTLSNLCCPEGKNAKKRANRSTSSVNS